MSPSRRKKWEVICGDCKKKRMVHYTKYREYLKNPRLCSPCAGKRIKAETWMTGRVAWNKGKKLGRPSKAKGRELVAMKGDKNPNWKGGTTPKNAAIRTSLPYKIWRRNVFERDDYTCQICSKRGGDLHIDHIKPFAYFPELRMELANGRVLCKECHMKTDTYLSGAIINSK